MVIEGSKTSPVSYVPRGVAYGSNEYHKPYVGARQDEKEHCGLHAAIWHSSESCRSKPTMIRRMCSVRRLARIEVPTFSLSSDAHSGVFRIETIPVRPFVLVYC